MHLKVLPTRLSWSQLLLSWNGQWSKCWFRGSVPFHLPPQNCFCNYLEWKHHLIPTETWWETDLSTWHLSPGHTETVAVIWDIFPVFPDRGFIFACGLLQVKRKKQVSWSCILTWFWLCSVSAKVFGCSQNKMCVPGDETPWHSGAVNLSWVTGDSVIVTESQNGLNTSLDH